MVTYIEIIIDHKALHETLVLCDMYNVNKSFHDTVEVLRFIRRSTQGRGRASLIPDINKARKVT